MTYKEIIFEKADRVGTVTLNRPQALNSTTDEMYQELIDVFGVIANDDDVGCVVITGAGRGFCAGSDIKGMGARNAKMTMLDKRKRHRWILSDVLQPFRNLEKPVIAAVNGPAAGAGFNLALAADMIMASENAAFVQSFKNLALVPDLGGLYLLTRVIGLNKAKELCFTARKVSAQEGSDLGFVNRIFPSDSLVAETQKIAADIAQGPPTALAMTKTLLNKSSDLSLGDMLEYESFAQAVAYSSAEHNEGVTAFKEKRQPNFAAAK